MITTKIIENLKVAFEPLKGKESYFGIEKRAYLKKFISRSTEADLIQYLRAGIPVVSTSARNELVQRFNYTWSQTDLVEKEQA
jgi:hypothetical protein